MDPVEKSKHVTLFASPVASSANTIYDGDKEYECEEDAPNPEDSRKVRLLKCEGSGTLFSVVEVYL